MYCCGGFEKLGGVGHWGFGQGRVSNACIKGPLSCGRSIVREFGQGKGSGIPITTIEHMCQYIPKLYIAIAI